MRWTQRICKIGVMAVVLFVVLAASQAHAVLQTNTGFYYPADTASTGGYYG